MEEQEGQLSTNSYIKISGTHMTGWLGERSGFENDAASRQVEAFWFFDDADHTSVSAAVSKSNAYRDRHLGARLQVSVWRRCPGIDKLPEVGEPTPGFARKWAA